MGILQIRQDFSALLKTVPGIREVQPYAPDRVGATPCIWIGDANATILMGSLEQWAWNVPMTLVVARKAKYEQEAIAVESLIDAIMEKIRSHYTLDDEVYGLKLETVGQGIVQVGGEPYAGATFSFTIKQKFNVTLTG